MFAELAIKNVMNMSKICQWIYYHSGRTDSTFGHRDNRDTSRLGSYHWHHGQAAHLHPCGNETISSEMAMYKYLYRKLYSASYLILPPYVEVAESSKNYTLGNLQKSFVNNGELLMGHKIVYSEDISNALRITLPIGPITADDENLTRHCSNDNFDTIDDTALAFILRYFTETRTRKNAYYSGINRRTYILNPDTDISPTSYYFQSNIAVPSNLGIEMEKFPKFDTEAFIYTDDTPLKWSLSFRSSLMNYYTRSNDLKVYYMRGNDVYCWTNLWIDSAKKFICTLDGFVENIENIEIIEEKSDFAQVTMQQMNEFGFTITETQLVALNYFLKEFKLSSGINLVMFIDRKSTRLNSSH